MTQVAFRFFSERIFRSTRRTDTEQTAQDSRDLGPSTPGMVPDVTLLNEREYYAATLRSAKSTLQIGARALSRQPLEPLALHGTRSALTWEELEQYIRTTSDTVFPNAWRLKQIWAAVILNCIVDFQDHTIDTAVRAFRLSLGHPGFRADALGQDKLPLYAHQLARLSGDTELLATLAARLPPPAESIWAAETDLLLAHAFGSSAAATQTWLSSFNAPLVDAGLEPWELDESSGEVSVFASLHAPKTGPAAVAPAQQALVTVIVPTYNPGPSFLNTIESLVHQSWQNLEILILDDASPMGAEYIAQAGAMDPRVSVRRLPENGGAYRARNAGIRQARGEFVTVLDADDQSHSRRIERQVQPLLEDPDLIATTTQAIRLFEDGTLTNFTSGPIRRNASSLLFRKAEVIDALGYYDEVDKAADSEFIERLNRKFGRAATRSLDEVLGLIQLTNSSLSRGDFRMGWWSGRRLAYRRQYMTWHKLALRAPGADFSVTREGARAFTAPASFVRTEEPSSLSFAVLADWSLGTVATREFVDTLQHLSKRYSETPIGLLTGVHPRNSSPDRKFVVPQPLWELIESGLATWISWRQPVEIDTLFVTDPEYLVYLPIAAEIGITVRRVVVVVDVPVARQDADVHIIDPVWLGQRVHAALGTAPIWLPATERLAAALRRPHTEVLAPGRLLALTPHLRRQDPAADHQRPTIGIGPMLPGTDAQEFARKLDTITVKRRHARTIFFDGYDVFSTSLDESPGSRYEIYPPHQGSITKSIEEIDITVLDPFDQQEGSVTRYVWHAVAHGVVVVMPERYAFEFGDAITSFGDGELTPLLSRLAEDQEFRRRRVQLANEALASYASEQRLASIIEAVRVPGDRHLG